MPSIRKGINSNYFTVYDRVWGLSLMTEARQRGMNRSEFVRTACDDYLRRNPANPNPGGRNHSDRNLDNQKK